MLQLCTTHCTRMCWCQLMTEGSAVSLCVVCFLQTKQWSGVVCSTCYLTQLLNSVRQMQQLQLLASQQESAVIKLQSAWRVRAAGLRHSHGNVTHCNASMVSSR